MRSLIVLFMCVVPVANAEVFAVGGIRGDAKGRIVLTTDPCDVDAINLQPYIRRTEV